MSFLFCSVDPHSQGFFRVGIWTVLLCVRVRCYSIITFNPEICFFVIHQKWMTLFMHYSFKVNTFCVSLNSNNFQRSTETWKYLGLPGFWSCLHTLLFCVSIFTIYYIVLLEILPLLAHNVSHNCLFFLRYEDGQVGDANINTQNVRIQKDILRVIGGQSTWLTHFTTVMLWDISQGNIWTEYGKYLPQTRCFCRC